MSVSNTLLKAVAAFGLLLAAGCGKPEDARGYEGGADTVTTSTSTEVKTPPPPLPAWAGPMMGQNLKQVSKGTAICKGALDVVTHRHTGAKRGAEIEGWGWDEHGARPLDKVLFTDASGKIVGGAVVGNPRADVKTAVSEVTTPNVGWRGVADVATDEVQAVGVTADGATCVLGQTILG